MAAAQLFRCSRAALLVALLVAAVAALAALAAAAGAAADDDGAAAAAPRDFPVRAWKGAWADPAQGGREVPVQVYYPDADGSTRFPLIVFAHCFVGLARWYEYYWSALVPRGYIVALFSQYGGDPFVGNASKYAEDQMFVLRYIREHAATDKSFFLYGRVALEAVGGAGHSLGGAATVLNANAFVSAAAFAPGEGMIIDIPASAQRVRVPFLLMDGTQDCISGRLTPLYWDNLVKTNCTYFADIWNATHCFFADLSEVEADACLFIERRFFLCPDGHGPVQLPQEEQHEIAMSFTALWWDYTLKKDAAAKRALDALFKSDALSGVVKNIPSRCP